MLERSYSKETSQNAILAIFAHPDDESLASGGLIAWCAELEVTISLLCMTRGQHGPGDSSTLGKTREKELHDAASVLGIKNVSVLDYEDGMLSWSNSSQIEFDIRQAIQQWQPDVVITFGEDGLYWHPDHIAVHQHTTAVIDKLGRNAPALYYVTLPVGSMRSALNRVTETTSSSGGAPSQIFGVTDVDAFGSMASPPTLVINSGHYARQKLTAIKCHVSQIRHNALAHLQDEDAENLLALEFYRRALVGRQDDTFIEQFRSEHH